MPFTYYLLLVTYYFSRNSFELFLHLLFGDDRADRPAVWAVFQVVSGEDGFGQGLELRRVGEIAGLDGGLAGDAVQGLVPEALGAVQPPVPQVAGDFRKRGRRVGLPDIRGDLPQQQVALPQIVQIVAKAQQQLPVLQQSRRLLPVKAAALRLEQGLAEDLGPLGQEAFKIDPLMGGVLVDEDQLLALLHKDVCAEDLAHIAEIRGLLHALQGESIVIREARFPLRA